MRSSLIEAKMLEANKTRCGVGIWGSGARACGLAYADPEGNRKERRIHAALERKNKGARHEPK